MSYTADEVMAEIARVMEDDIVEFWYGYGDDELFGQPVKVIEEFGGEGCGDERWIIFQIGNQFFKKTGYYDSWEGSNWSEGGFFEVKPKEVMVTKYVEVDDD